MTSETKYHTFFEELKLSLPDSTGEQRKEWATKIVNEDLSIRDLSDLLFMENKIATRFLWLLSDVGTLDKIKLREDLVFLFDRCSTLEHIRIEASFANYWLICGVPEEKEGIYIDHLFNWLGSSKTNVTAKSRALFVLNDLSRKYPEIKNELTSVIIEQLDRNTSDFRKRATKILKIIEEKED